jgi:hypothetical protein
MITMTADRSTTWQGGHEQRSKLFIAIAMVARDGGRILPQRKTR